jgi:2'-phosphotransferase
MSQRNDTRRNKNRNQSQNRNPNQTKEFKEKQLSKALSWILRHGAPKLNLSIASDGYIPVQAVLQCQARNMTQYSLDDIIQVVDTNNKQRFKLCTKGIVWKDNEKKRYSFVTNDDNDSSDNNIKGGIYESVLCIRANQGHSISGINCEELLTLIPPDELSKMDSIVHGTRRDAWEKHIQHEGLNKMNRNHIHFASGLPGEDGVISGMRTTSQVYIYINGGVCAQDGIKFYRSSNGVILTAGSENGILPIRYFANVVDARTNKKLN